jgi:hypothetical protein
MADILGLLGRFTSYIGEHADSWAFFAMAVVQASSFQTTVYSNPIRACYWVC